ncbi:MbnP family protein [Hymenobacter negativus]|uniref:Copper-binding protein MbnP-like domain-containing protein n=1 Tax=Hymenobacter negativus TaxID=2795026 RepID=A0ABS3QHV3_9BACT|nr:MbnP family protein [Hymenobacter negativus]MBO2010832.1 hypothetical protein [Hymenobacter negativus]
MKQFSIAAFAYSLAFAALTLTGCKKDEPAAATTGEFTLHMANVVGTAPLALDVATYQNANGDNFTVSTFKYYISNVILRKSDNSTYAVPNSYFLVDQSKADSQDLLMKDVPVGDYTGITFTVGVDSARTKAGNFTGVLNANNGMYWDMNGPEFINVKLEGRSQQAPSTGLIFHIAGYKHSTTNTIRTVTLPFPSSSLLIRTDHSPEIHTNVDVLKMFTGANGTNIIRFADIYNTMGGPNSVKVADNIAAGMFTVEHIHAN